MLVLFCYLSSVGEPDYLRWDIRVREIKMYKGKIRTECRQLYLNADVPVKCCIVQTAPSI